jgi:hypothetical protein
MVVVIIVYLFSLTICPAKITGKYREIRAIYIVVMVKVTLAETLRPNSLIRLFASSI